MEAMKDDFEHDGVHRPGKRHEIPVKTKDDKENQDTKEEETPGIV